MGRSRPGSGHTGTGPTGVGHRTGLGEAGESLGQILPEGDQGPLEAAIREGVHLEVIWGLGDNDRGVDYLKVVGWDTANPGARDELSHPLPESSGCPCTALGQAGLVVGLDPLEADCPPG